MPGARVLAAVAVLGSACGRLDFEAIEAQGTDQDAASTTMADAADSGAFPADCVQTNVCSGLLLYLDFDGDYATHEDVAPSGVSETSVVFVPGRYEQGVDVGGTLSYSADGHYDVQQGTLTFWAKPSWSAPCSSTHLLFSAGFSAPYVSCDSLSGTLGIAQGLPAVVQATAPGESFSSYWSTDSWHHVAATWSQSEAPSLAFMLDGDPAEGSPTYLKASDAWSVSMPSELNLGGQLGARPDIVLDDVAIWDRAMSKAELSCIYQTYESQGQSLGDICDL